MKCFVIMPFSETCHHKDDKEIRIPKDEWTYIFENWIKKAVESYPDKTIICKRSGANPGNFIKGIVQDIYDSDIVIADLTGKKANVYYELGIRHSLKLGTITISQELAAVPSDLQSYYCFEYTYSSKNYEGDKLYKEFENEMHDKIRHVVSNLSLSDSPVSDFLNLEHYYSVNSQRKQGIRLFEIILELIDIYEQYLEVFEEVIKNENKHISTPSPPSLFINLSIFDALYALFLSTNFDLLDKASINRVRGLMKDSSDVAHSSFQLWMYCKHFPTSTNIKNFINTIKNSKKSLDAIVGMRSGIMAYKERYKNGEIGMEKFFQ